MRALKQNFVVIVTLWLLAGGLALNQGRRECLKKGIPHYSFETKQFLQIIVSRCFTLS